MEGKHCGSGNTGAYLVTLAAGMVRCQLVVTIARIVATDVLCKHMSPVAGVSVGSPSYAG